MKILDKIRTFFGFSIKKAKSEKIIRYCGYDLYYSEGTSIVDRYILTGQYEEKTIQALFDSLQSTHTGAFLDVGANVGLISLAVAEKFPQVKVYAFEPGPHQFKLIEKTIHQNQLNDHIFLFDVALSDANGEAFFHIHQTIDASGDGFLDTGRAGKTRKIRVVTQTLDDWWVKNGKPSIGVIKCDTEGAELMVLKGGTDLITTCKPHILLEIFHTNLLKYPYGPENIFNWLQDKNYSLFNSDKKLVSLNELEELCKHESEFLALPKL